MVTNDIIFQAKTVFHNLVIKKWLTEDVFSLRWWSLIAIVAVSYILCFSLLDKRRLTTLFLFGSLIAVVEGVSETIGVNFLLWSCTTPLLPIVPCLFVPYLTVIPAFYMLIYQYTTNWRQFSLWNLIAASILDLIIQPIFIYFNIYEVNNWNVVYNIPLTFGITSLARAVTLFLVSIEQHQKKIP